MWVVGVGIVWGLGDDFLVVEYVIYFGVDFYVVVQIIGCCQVYYQIVVGVVESWFVGMVVGVVYVYFVYIGGGQVGVLLGGMFQVQGQVELVFWQIWQYVVVLDVQVVGGFGDFIVGVGVC